MGHLDTSTKRTSYRLRRPRGQAVKFYCSPDPPDKVWENPEFLQEMEDESMAMGPWKFPKNGEPFRKIQEGHVRRYVHGTEADESLRIINCLRILRREKVPLRYVDPVNGSPTVEIYLDRDITTPGWYSTKEVITLFCRLGSIAQLGEAFINVSNDGLLSIGQFLRELENVRFIAPFTDEEVTSSLGPIKIGQSKAGVSTGFPIGEDPYGIGGGCKTHPWEDTSCLSLSGNTGNPDDPTDVPVGSIPLPRLNSSVEDLELFLEELCDSATWTGTIFPEIYVRKTFLKNLFFNCLPFHMGAWYPRYRWVTNNRSSTKLGNKGFLMNGPESARARWGQHPDVCPPCYGLKTVESTPILKPYVRCSPSDEGYW
jgi:hypothetical protein